MQELVRGFNPASEVKELIDEDHVYDSNIFIIAICKIADVVLTTEDLLRIMNEAKV